MCVCVGVCVCVCVCVLYENRNCVEKETFLEKKDGFLIQNYGFVFCFVFPLSLSRKNTNTNTYEIYCNWTVGTWSWVDSTRFKNSISRTIVVVVVVVVASRSDGLKKKTSFFSEIYLYYMNENSSMI